MHIRKTLGHLYLLIESKSHLSDLYQQLRDRINDRDSAETCAALNCQRPSPLLCAEQNDKCDQCQCRNVALLRLDSIIVYINYMHRWRFGTLCMRIGSLNVNTARMCIYFRHQVKALLSEWVFHECTWMYQRANEMTRNCGPSADVSRYANCTCRRNHPQTVVFQIGADGSEKMRTMKNMMRMFM